jgi:hypothetical protein
MSEPHAQEPHAQVYRPEGGKTIKGLFSTQTVEKVGTGTTQRKTISKMYWYCVQGDDGTVGVQALNKNMVPAGPSTQVPLDDFLAKYNPEPEMYLKTVFPKMRELASSVTRAEESRQRGARYSAQFEYEKRAVHRRGKRAEQLRPWGLPTWSAGRTATGPGHYSGASWGWRRPSPGAQAPVQRVRHSPAQKRMVDQSIEYYTRALALYQHGENLHYNVARAYFEKGDTQNGREHLTRRPSA